MVLCPCPALAHGSASGRPSVMVVVGSWSMLGAMLVAAVLMAGKDPRHLEKWAKEKTRGLAIPERDARPVSAAAGRVDSD